jgi:aryl sulfotransferase
MARISPWVDMNTRPLADVVADLDAQTHRRFMKAHLPFDVLPHDDRVTYITVGRDPRDVAISMANHMDNVDMANFIMERAAAVGLDDLAEMNPEDLPDLSGPMVERFWRWIEDDSDDGLQGVVKHLRSFWDHRDDPNVVLLHYADLQADLVGQMQYLAERLGIERSRDRLEELAPFASFDEMKQHAEATAPNGDQTFWRSTSDFFRNGTTGQWRALMADDELPRYEKRLHELVDGDLAHWLEHGSLG